jgi:glycosyltransferase involved in cell wall biosynthesis
MRRGVLQPATNLACANVRYELPYPSCQMVMSNKPLVSVIIPCYNAACFIGDTLGSALAQSYREIEIIVIDDGSTDGTRRIIESYGHRVRAEFGPNRGASAARNRGTELARGEFIQYLDADDLLGPDALVKRVEALQQSGADVAYSDWQKLVESEGGRYEPGDVFAVRLEDIKVDAAIAIFTDAFWSPPAALLYRRSMVGRIGQWNESLPIIQDARFLLDAALQGGKFVHVPGIGAHYREHGSQSLSRRSNVAFNRDCFENAIQVRDWWQEHGGIGSEKRKALLSVIGYCARQSYDNDKVLFRKACEALEELNPHYLPDHPKLLRLFSRFVGYQKAEAVASLYRKARRFAGRDSAMRCPDAAARRP